MLECQMALGNVGAVGKSTVEMIEMTDLVFYRNENKEFKEAFEKKLDYKEARIVFKKLMKHYKLYGSLEFTNRIGAGKCYWGSNLIQLRWKTNFGIMCHEVSHLIHHKRYGMTKRHHTKKLRKIMKSMVNYCKKKNYWEDELTKRTKIKVKPIPTPKEIRLKKIEKRKQDLIRYEKKLKYYTKIYTNKIKKTKRSLMMLERYASS